MRVASDALSLNDGPAMVAIGLAHLAGIGIGLKAGLAGRKTAEALRLPGVRRQEPDGDASFFDSAAPPVQAPAIIRSKATPLSGSFVLDWTGQPQALDTLPELMGYRGAAPHAMAEYCVRNGGAVAVLDNRVRLRADRVEPAALEAAARYLASLPMDRLLTVEAGLPAWLTVPDVAPTEASMLIHRCRQMARESLPAWRSEQVDLMDAPRPIQRMVEAWRQTGGRLTREVFEPVRPGAIPLDLSLVSVEAGGRLLYQHVGEQPARFLGSDWARSVIGQEDSGCGGGLDYTANAQASYYRAAGGGEPLIERIHAIAHPEGREPIWLSYWRMVAGWRDDSLGRRVVTATCFIRPKLLLYS